MEIVIFYAIPHSLPWIPRQGVGD